eukprot:CAMPEP_0183589406 /NCGR_PEP_ID=MMETSP0371-20130417/162632_1 /TAXON_ID=268820 /ORGANISM="Peridinium aciculiferum, Strain PAER-2" /LENGTH=63 /DNA_ID=CAMNT_0025800723 /DNA_START=125 /DNA_END=316 /DNA_ORIENTATION=-
MCWQRSLENVPVLLEGGRHNILEVFKLQVGLGAILHDHKSEVAVPVVDPSRHSSRAANENALA